MEAPSPNPQAVHASHRGVPWSARASTGYHEAARDTGPLAEAAHVELDAPGRPLRRLTSERALRGLKALLWEQVSDPETARQLAASRGYCFEHTWALLPVAERVSSRVGMATIVKRLLGEYLHVAEFDQTDQLRRWLRPTRPWPACVTVRRTQATYARAIAGLYRSNPFLAARTPAVLCRPHLTLVLRSLEAVDCEAFQAEAEARQRTSLEAATLSASLAIIAGAKPAWLPEAARSCPACQATRLQRPVERVTSCCRLHAWLLREVPEQLDLQALVVCSSADCRLCAAARLATARDVPTTEPPFLCLGQLRAVRESAGGVQC